VECLFRNRDDAMIAAGWPQEFTHLDTQQATFGAEREIRLFSRKFRLKGLERRECEQL